MRRHGGGGDTIELWLVRHGSTHLNERRRFQGRIDPPLSARGRREAERAARILSAGAGGRRIRLWSSDLRRARETAGLLGAGEPTVDARLAELDFGLFEGCTWEEAETLAPGALEAWLDDPWRAPPPGGERLGALIERIAAWLAELDRAARAERGPDGAAPLLDVAVTHAGPVAGILHVLLDRPWREAFELRPDPGGLVRLLRDARGWTLGPDGPA